MTRHGTEDARGRPPAASGAAFDPRKPRARLGCFSPRKAAVWLPRRLHGAGGRPQRTPRRPQSNRRFGPVIRRVRRYTRGCSRSPLLIDPLLHVMRPFVTGSRNRPIHNAPTGRWFIENVAISRDRRLCHEGVKSAVPPALRAAVPAIAPSAVVDSVQRMIDRRIRVQRALPSGSEQSRQPVVMPGLKPGTKLPHRPLLPSSASAADTAPESYVYE